MTLRRPIALLLVLVVLGSVRLGATTYNPADAAGLTSALSTVACGDTINLNAGTTYTGNWTLPNLNCTGPAYITIQTTTCPVASGVRNDVANVASMAVLRSTNGDAIIYAAYSGADIPTYYKFVCVEFTAATTAITNMVQLGTGTETLTSQLPLYFTFDRVVFSVAGSFSAKNALWTQAAHVSVIDSYFDNIKHTGGEESHCVVWYNTTGDYTLDNNYFECASIPYLSGGSAMSLPSGTAPTNLTIRRNTIRKRLAWQGAGYNVKNGGEIKCGDTVLIESNDIADIFSDGQEGQAGLLTVRGYGWCYIKHVIVRYNYAHNVCGFYQISGAVTPEGGDTSTVTDSGDYLFFNNLVQMNTPGSALCAGGTGKFIQAGYSPDSVVLSHNTVISDTPSVPVVDFDISTSVMGEQPPGFQEIDNVFAGSGGIFFSSGSGLWGTGDLNAYFGSGQWTVTGNCWGGWGTPGVGWGNTNDFPGGNTYVETSTTMEALFVDFAGGNYRLIPSGTCGTAGVDYSLLPGQSSTTTTTARFRRLRRVAP